MPDIQVRTHEAGERDLELGELTARARALLGARACTSKRNPEKHPADTLCVVSVFLDDRDDLPLPCRSELVIGEGASFAEALARARDAVMRGFVKERRPDGSNRVINLADYGIRPVIA